MAFDLTWNIRHDYFNLCVLPLICAINLYFLAVDRSAYWVEYFSFLAYLIVDTVWLFAVPGSVVSPTTVIAHHLVCIVGWSLPVFNDLKYHDWLSYGILVEINTWLLTARRNFKESFLLNFLFYLTWVGFRLIMYPIILYYFVFQYVEDSVQWATYINVGLYVLVLMIAINSLNFKWSFELFSKMLRSPPPSPLSSLEKGLDSVADKSRGL